MKKLRMIITAIVVLAIVGSAFTFTTKGVGRFCVLTTVGTGTSTNCTTYLAAIFKKTSDIAAASWKYYPCWDMDPVGCTATGNGRCTETAKLTTD
jgi:hypothetical protein